MPKVEREDQEAIKIRNIILSVANHKGGTGKTTFSVGLLAALMNPKRKMLLIDMDPQGNATDWLHKNVYNGMKNMGDIIRSALKDDISSGEGAEKFLSLVSSTTQVTSYGPKIGSYCIIPATLDLAQAKADMLARGDVASNRVIDAIRKISSFYDITIIDTPPQLEKLTFAALAASDFLVLVTTPELMAVGGAKDVADHIFPDVKKYYNNEIELLGVVMNQWTKTRLTNEVMPNIDILFGDGLLFKTPIKRSQSIMEMPSRRDFFHDFKKGRHSDGSNLEEFTLIAKELMSRINASYDRRGLRHA